MKKAFSKTLSLVLSAALVFTGVSINDTKQVSAATTISVSTYSALLGVQDQLNAASGDVVININSDITVKSTDADYVPFYVGWGKGENITSLTINGNSHTISGLKVTDSWSENKSFVGGFDNTNAEFVLANITIDNFNVSGTRYIGAAVSEIIAKSATLTNVKVTNSKIYGSNEYIGGLVGYAENTHFVNCETDANTVVGAVAAGAPDGNYVGGIVGFLKSGLLAQCTNNANIDGSAIQNNDHFAMGGLVGSAWTKNYYYNKSVSGFTPSVIVITNCINNGDIDTERGVATGGIIGAGDVDIDNTVNNGNISVDKGDCVGGIVGIAVGDNAKHMLISTNNIRSCLLYIRFPGCILVRILHG